MTAVTLEGVIHGLPELEYHAHPALSSTGVRHLLPEYKGSPKKFRYYQEHKRTSRAFDVGHSVHAKVLGVGAPVVVYPDEHLTPSGNVSTKAATKEWEDEQRANGLTPVSPEEIGRVEAMSEAVLAHETARPYFEVAVHREVSVFSEIDGVQVRARFDALSDETRSGTFAVDLKTADDASDDGFTFSVKKWGYDVQEGFYRDVHEAAVGRPIDQFKLIAVEKAAPFEVAVFELPLQWVQMGRRKAAEGRRIFRECMESGVWPGYAQGVRVLDPPAWAVIEHEMRYETAEVTF